MLGNQTASFVVPGYRPVALAASDDDDSGVGKMRCEIAAAVWDRVGLSVSASQGVEDDRADWENMRSSAED